MSDKNLTELEWKKFSKGKGYKDAAFIKAVAALETGKTPQARLDALADIEKQADLLRKAAKADKELGSYLDDAEKAAGLERKRQELEARKVAASASAAGADDEEDSPALLTTKLIPLLRQVKKGETMHALVASVGNEAAVLLSKQSISPSRRKLLTDYLGATGGVKFAAGEAIWEENAVTFVLQTSAAGMAKKLKAALLKQIEQRTKVRVRGEDPNDIDDDGDEHDGESAEQEAGESEGQDAVGAAAKVEPVIPPVPPLPAASDAATATAFNARLAALLPKAKEAIAAGGPNANDVKRKVGEAGIAARRHEFGPANALLDEAQALIDSASGEPAQDVVLLQYQQRLSEIEPRYLAALQGNPADATRLRAVFGYVTEQAAGRVYVKALEALSRLERMILDASKKPAEDSGHAVPDAYRRTLLNYRAAAFNVKSQIASLKAAIPGHLPDDAELADELAEALGALNDDLLASIDQAVNASPTTPSSLQAQVAALIAEVAADPLIRHVDRNPYGVSMSVGKTLREALEGIRDAMPEPV